MEERRETGLYTERNLERGLKAGIKKGKEARGEGKKALIQEIKSEE